LPVESPRPSARTLQQGCGAFAEEEPIQNYTAVDAAATLGVLL
jgi:hypothetical protein